MERKTKKRKKGRPSLLELQKRTLKQQQQLEEQQQKSSPNFNSKPSQITPIPYRRSTRRNRNDDVITPSTDEHEDAIGKELNRKRREKELKLVLKFPASLDSGSDSNGEDHSGGKNQKKRKFNESDDGSGNRDAEKADQHVSAPKPANIPEGTQLDMGPSTPLPDKSLLLFILDRLQKKDTYSVFAEPVDPDELQDYHEVIEHPMDFGTVRKNLDIGAYTNMEQFEKDVFLICSNAMQYNSPDTIYFRQARSIQELAIKDFENLRQDSDDNGSERKVIRRGRPPTKNFKKSMVKPFPEHVELEFSSDATLANGAENNTWSNYNTRRGPFSDKFGLADFSGQYRNGYRRSVSNSGWLAEQKSERKDEFTGSMSQGRWMKQAKKQVVFDESRRNTYTQSHLAQEPLPMTIFDGERKQLMAVGYYTECGYAKSLVHFAANLGPVAWKVSTKKTERSLPAGVKFGPGWVGENVVLPPKPLMFSLPSTIQPSTSHSLYLPGNTLAMKVKKSSDELEGHNSSDKLTASSHSAINSQLPKLSRSPTSVPSVGDRFPETTSGSSKMIRHGPTAQHPVIYSGMNGLNGT